MRLVIRNSYDMSGTDEERWDAANEAAELLAEGDHDGAIRFSEGLIERDARNEYAYFFLGCAHFEKGEAAKAMKAFVKALEIAPGYLGAMVHLGHALRVLGRTEEALRVGREVLLKSPTDPDGLYLMGLCFFARGENVAATQMLQRFLETRPEIELALEVEGMLQTLRGEVVPMPESEYSEN